MCFRNPNISWLTDKVRKGMRSYIYANVIFLTSTTLKCFL